MKITVYVIAHDLRSTHNVGSLLRTADALGVTKVFFTGYTAYPEHANDKRLPHEASKIARQINKTALGAEHSVAWQHVENVNFLINSLRKQGFEICALEQTKNSISLSDYRPRSKVALILGREVEGIMSELLKLTDKIVEIPMSGKKESLNVVQAAAIALYHIRYNANI